MRIRNIFYISSTLELFSQTGFFESMKNSSLLTNIR